MPDALPADRVAPPPRRQFERLAPYRAAIAKTCAEAEESPDLLGAICLRESGTGYAPGYAPQGHVCGWGDHGFAMGLFQIDRRFHHGFVFSEQARSVEGQCGYACQLLRDARHFLRHSRAWKSDEELERAAIASYNAGPGNVLHAVNEGRDPDSVTTGKDYSADVLKRAAALRAAGFFAAQEVA